MREHWAEIPVVRVGTPRSVLLPQLMVEEVEGLGPVLLLPALAVPVAVSGQKGRRPALLRHTAHKAGAVVVQQQV